jgi:hypothetical protein
MLHRTSLSSPAELTIAAARLSDEPAEPTRRAALPHDHDEPDPVMPDPRYVYEAHHQAQSLETSGSLDNDDDIIVIEDDPGPADLRPAVRRKEYRQLFASLRHG